MFLFGAFCLLTLPWLNPFTFGPTPAVVPWLFSMACAGALLGIVGVTTATTAPGMDRQEWVRAIAGAWLIAALISAAIGLVQYFGASAALTPWVNGTELGEAYGNLRQRNQFATLMAMGLAALVWWVIQGASWRLAVAAAALLAMGSVASSSRTGLLQWLLCIAVATQCGGDRRSTVRRVLLTAALAYAVATVGLPWLAGLDPMTSGAWARLREGDAACMGRLTLWSNVLHLIAQKPWLGWGWGELGHAHFVTLYPGPRFCDILDNAHNLPLHLAVELGAPIAAALCGAGLWVVIRAKPWREKDPTRQMAWTILALIGLHSLLEYPLWYGPFQIAVGLCAWLLLGSPKPPVWIAWVAALMLAGCAYAAWDYWRISQIYLPVDERSSYYRDNTMDKLRKSWLFESQVQFAELTTTNLTADNAEQIYKQALQLLHFSSEPRVIEKLIESATLLGRNDDAAYYLQRYKAAFPDAYARWTAASAGHKAP